MSHNYNLLHEGKIRKMYEYDDDHLIMFTTDRVSAFDVVLPDTIPGKGNILTRITKFWMNRYWDTIPNHTTDIVIDDSQFDEPGCPIVVKRLRPLPVEAIVRGYIIGSGWKDYQTTGAICGIQLPEGLQLAEKLPEPIFTPSTKAPKGQHDENVSFDTVADLLGRALADQIRDISLFIFNSASEYAAGRGILIADTKFEFGLDVDGKVYLIDEVLTPDSSRYWDAEKYQVGISPESYDKQIIRDYLESIKWNKKPPAPQLPREVIEKTARRYREVESKLLTL